MLRIVVLILLLSNAAYYAWSHGMLGAALAPVVEGEPQRLEQQIHPEYLHVVLDATGLETDPLDAPQPGAPAEEAMPEEAPAYEAAAEAEADTPAPAVETATNPPPSSTPARQPARGICLQAGIFDTPQADALRRALTNWPADSWQLETVQINGRWMVYLGPLADEKAVLQRRSELRAKGIDFDRPGLAREPGLSLGRYSTEAAAQRARQDLIARGIGNTRIVVDRPPGQGFSLRLPSVDDDLRVRLRALRPALGGKTLQPCP